MYYVLRDTVRDTVRQTVHVTVQVLRENIEVSFGTSYHIASTRNSRFHRPDGKL